MTEPDPELAPTPIAIRLKPAMLARWDLPDIGYPLTLELLAGALEGEGELPFAVMLSLLQQRSAAGGAAWQAFEPALARLTELVAPVDEREVVSAAGPEWWVEIGPVDLSNPVVTIQRRDELVAALARRDDGRLRLATFRPLDARSAALVIAMSRRPHAENGTVCMRANNWEYALDCSAGTGQYYAWQRGESYLAYWDEGLGQRAGTTEQQWLVKRHWPGRAPALVAIELGVAYAFSESP